jgi:hypothetical protein
VKRRLWAELEVVELPTAVKTNEHVGSLDRKGSPHPR